VNILKRDLIETEEHVDAWKSIGQDEILDAWDLQPQ
jgi:hypothetical protein